MKKHERPEVTTSYTVRELTGCGKMYVTIGKDNGQVIEVLAVLGKGGNCAAAQNEAITRAVSLGLKYGVPLKEYMKDFYKQLLYSERYKKVWEYLKRLNFIQLETNSI